MNRARIREIALEVMDGYPHQWKIERREAIESAILRAIEELLTQEPSEGMIDAAHGISWPNNIMPTYIYCVMSAQLLKEVKGE